MYPQAARLAREIVSGAICVAAPGRELERNLPGDSALLVSAREIFEAIRDKRAVPKVPQELLALYRPSVQPFLRSVFQFDPIALAAALSQPLLLVAGDDDLQVPVSDSEELLLA